MLIGLSHWVAGQATSNSPYSSFGLGDRISEGMVRNMSMGDTKYSASDYFHLNPANPASYSRLIATSFNVGFNYQVNNLTGENGSQRYDVAGLRYFGLGFPISKRVGAALGLTPLTQTGYDINASGTVDGEFVRTNYSGDGGISRAFIGLSYEIISDSNRQLSVGSNLSYIFGPVSEITTINFPSNGSAYSTYESQRLNHSDLSADLGVQYRMDLARKNHLDRFLTIGGTYKFGGNIRTRKEVLLGNLDLGRLKDTLAAGSDTGNVFIPARFGVGVGMEFFNRNTKRRLQVHAEYEFGAWSQMEVFGVNEGLNDNWQLAAGAEYIPDAEAIRGFFKTMRYRGGFHYGKTYLNVNNEDIYKYGITFGLGIPLVKSKSVYATSSSINIGLETGQRAYNNTGLISEQYTNLLVGIVLTPSFWDRWFQKRRID